MITKFDKNAKAEYFKAEFADCLDDMDYECALDNLLKYSDEVTNPDFHLACGMLYLQMTQDSDDSELYDMAYREFLMHIRRFPDCTAAYRNIIAALFLRGSIGRAIVACKWVRKRGIDVNAIMNELAEAGIAFIAPGAPVDIEGMFAAGEYGSIDPLPNEEKTRSYADVPYSEILSGTTEKQERDLSDDERETENFLNGITDCSPSKVIKFHSDMSSFHTRGDVRAKIERITPDVPHSMEVMDFRRDLEKLERILDEDDGFYADDEDETDATAVLEEMHRRVLGDYLLKADDDYNDKNYGGENCGSSDYLEDFSGEIERGNGIDPSDVHRMTANEHTSSAIDAALFFYEHREYDKAQDILDGITEGNGDISKALAVRALIALDFGDDKGAERYLKRALENDKTNPLVNLALCSIYDERGQGKKIPPLLKNIDLTDFVNMRHVYRIAELAVAYCKRADGMEVLERLIDEYNILSFRSIYAQMLYNSGKKEEARDELYLLSRVLYNEMTADILYTMAKLNEKKLPETLDAPSEIISVIVENLMELALTDGIGEEYVRSEIFERSVNLFAGLTFEQSKKVLVKMIKTLRVLTCNEYTRELMFDALVSPYVEDFAKAVILSEILEGDRNAEFLMDCDFLPVSNECVRRLDDKYGDGYRTAYAFAITFCRGDIDGFLSDCAGLYAALDGKQVDSSAIAYYLFKNAAKRNRIKVRDRDAYAMGFVSKTEANKSYNEIDSILKNTL